PTDPCRLIVTGNLKLAGVLSGGADLEKTDGGDLVLSAANTFTGRMLVREGVLSVGANQALGATSAGTELFGDGLLRLDGRRGVAHPPLDLAVAGEALTVLGPAAIQSAGGSNVWAGPISAPVDPCRFVTFTSLELAGAIGGAGDVEKLGAAPLILSAANTFTGKMTVVTGPLSVRNDDGLGSPAGATELVAGATLELFDGVTITDEVLNLIAHSGGRPGFPPSFHLGSGGGNNFWGGQIHTNVFAEAPTFEIVAASRLELAGAIDGGTD